MYCSQRRHQYYIIRLHISSRQKKELSAIIVHRGRPKKMVLSMRPEPCNKYRCHFVLELEVYSEKEKNFFPELGIYTMPTVKAKRKGIESCATKPVTHPPEGVTTMSKTGLSSWLRKQLSF
ncbi:hypothetical protein M758_5G099700 [Ceratodon purpureus]|nr:hypothetical protein M758_5G099700 [Ceratodon purpureus]